MSRFRNVRARSPCRHGIRRPSRLLPRECGTDQIGGTGGTYVGLRQVQLGIEKHTDTRQRLFSTNKLWIVRASYKWFYFQRNFFFYRVLCRTYKGSPKETNQMFSTTDRLLIFHISSPNSYIIYIKSSFGVFRVV